MEELNGIPVYYFTIDEEITDEGVTFISFVDDPAVEKSFIKLSKNNDSDKILLKSMNVKMSANDEKRIVTGVALRADFPIYRNDGGEEYYMQLSKDEILKIAQKFMKEQRLKSVNLNHRYNTKDIYLFESYILDKNHKLSHDDFNDIEEGSWMVSYKVDNDEVWKSIKNGEFKGFSVEMSGELIGKLKKNKSCNQLTNKIMAKSKLQLSIDKLKSDIESVLKGIIKLGSTENVELSSITTDENIELFFDGDELVKGMLVYIKDESGSNILAPDGDYNYDNKVYHVINGIVDGITSNQDNSKTKLEIDPGNVPTATGNEVTVDSFNQLAGIVKEVIVVVDEIENELDFIEEFKKQQAELTQQNAELKKEVTDTKQKLESALKNRGSAIKQKPISQKQPEASKNEKEVEFFAAIQK